MKTIAIYDLEENLITTIEGYKEVAKYFNTSIGVIKNHMCLKRKDNRNKKRLNGKWYRLEEIEMSRYEKELELDVEFFKNRIKVLENKMDKVIKILKYDLKTNEKEVYKRDCRLMLEMLGE